MAGKVTRWQPLASGRGLVEAVVGMADLPQQEQEACTMTGEGLTGNQPEGSYTTTLQDNSCFHSA